MLNLSALFYSTTEPKTFLKEIGLTSNAHAELLAARAQVREELRLKLPHLLETDAEVKKAIRPRFFMQGSCAYKTINAPARSGQQADLDDGTYLPMTFVTGAKPSVASRAFFTAVDFILLELAQRNNWKVITDKSTCSRVEISSTAHIDVPLYAIPDHEFLTLEKRALEFGHAALTEAALAADQQTWTELPNGTVLLATRTGAWQESDPRPINDWFLTQIAAHGEQMRRVVRYLKAWRDWTWLSNGPCSLLLMIALSRTFSAKERRDDLALLEAVRRLPSELRQGISNPVQPAEILTDKLGDDGVKDLIVKLEDLTRHLDAAIMQSTNAAQSCAWLREKFGPRFPHNPAAVKISSATAVVAATAAATVPSPVVGRTISG